ncbi:MAG: SEC-C metal-binding domain-containing protein, partial [Acidimicrobiales bacterium]
SMPGGEETMRSLEREVMLQLIDQKWREHLSEMDYLREGINLRAMGQQDPLVAWQRDGYQMFGQLMSSIDDDYVKIVMHAQVQVLEQAPAANGDGLAGAQYQAADDPVQGNSGLARTLAAGPAPGEEVVFASGEEEAAVRGGNLGGAGGESARSTAVAEAASETMQPVVKDSAFDRVGRNDPCPCGSGKKFKFCHGH